MIFPWNKVFCTTTTALTLFSLLGQPRLRATNPGCQTDPDCQLSSAQVLFGRPLRDAFTFATRLEKFSNHNILPLWRDAWQAKEDALRQRYHRTTESLKEHTRPLPPLNPGDRCYIQNQAGNHPKRWNRSGTVLEVLGYDSYLVKVDGSGRVTQRNRRFLRKFTSPSTTITYPTGQANPFEHLPSDPELIHSDVRSDGSFEDDIVHKTTDTVNIPSELVDNNVHSQPDTEDSSQDVDSYPQTMELPPLPTPTPQHCRSVRVRKPKKYYEPETGKWVDQS